MRFTEAQGAAFLTKLRAAQKKIDAALTAYHRGEGEDAMAHALGYTEKCLVCRHETTEHDFNGQCFHADKRTVTGRCLCHEKPRVA